MTELFLRQNQRGHHADLDPISGDCGAWCRRTLFHRCGTTIRRGNGLRMVYLGWSMLKSIWWFPKIAVPPNGWFIMQNPIKMDDFGVPLFQETSICWNQWDFYDSLCLSMSAPIPPSSAGDSDAEAGNGFACAVSTPINSSRVTAVWTRTDQPGTCKALPAFHWHFWFLTLSPLLIFM